MTPATEPRSTRRLVLCSIASIVIGACRCASHAPAAPAPPAPRALPDGGWVQIPDPWSQSQPGRGPRTVIWTPTTASAQGGVCLGQTQIARGVPLDMYVMLDRSGSMLAPARDTADGSKWDAVVSALMRFVHDPRSEGLGMGLQYFPLARRGAPEGCAANAECGSNGPCLHRVCSDLSYFCRGDRDCNLGTSCVPLGHCELNPSRLCAPPGADGCDTEGPCIERPGRCLRFEACDPDAYAKSAVPVRALPGNRDPLERSLRVHFPVLNGLTPTAPALSGALRHAQSRAAEQPERAQIVVLATDGLPTPVPGEPPLSQCNRVDKGEVADIAYRARLLGVRTYVIGVLSKDDARAADNLHELAKRGGTGEALIVDPTRDLTDHFVGALNQIRGHSLDCEFKLPSPPPGRPLDLGKVNLRYTNDSGQEELLHYVGTEPYCKIDPRGWYYDQPRSSGVPPSKIVVCEHVCDTFQHQGGGQLDIEIGCTTITLL